MLPMDGPCSESYLRPDQSARLPVQDIPGEGSNYTGGQNNSGGLVSH